MYSNPKEKLNLYILKAHTSFLYSAQVVGVDKVLHNEYLLFTLKEPQPIRGSPGGSRPRHQWDQEEVPSALDSGSSWQEQRWHGTRPSCIWCAQEGIRAFGGTVLNDYFTNIHTTLQSKMNAKLSNQRFWHCHEKGLIKRIQTIPRITTYVWVSSCLPFTVD